MASHVKPSDFLRHVISETGISQSDNDSQNGTGHERDADSALALMKLAETRPQGGRHKCLLCHAEFTILLALHRHMSMYHSVRKRQQCLDCGKRFVTSESLSRHSKTSHLNQKPFQCTVCMARFSTRLAQERHALIHSGEKPHACDFCQKAFRSKATLLDHVGGHLDEKPYKCDVCSETFVRVADLRLHSVTHSDVKVFDCGICDRSFYSAKRLVKHLHDHQSADKLSNKKFRCSCCDVIFVDLTEMEDHVKQCHPPNVRPLRTPVPVNQATNYNCSECQVYYETYDDLSVHLEALHHLCQCRHCYLQYTSKQALKVHIRQSHCSFYALACHICDKNFSDQGSLNRHVATHDLYTCPHCDASFQEEAKLKNHQTQQHNPEIMENCAICSQQFGSKSRLKRHLQCHLPPALHKCKICHAGFNQDKMVERHLEVVHHVTRPRPEEPNSPSRTYQIVQDGETISVLLVDGAGTDELKAMISSSLEDVFVCNVCNTEFMEKDDLNVHVTEHSIPELLLAIVEQEKARATIAGAPVPKEIVVTKSGSDRADLDQGLDSDDDLDDLEHEAFMRNRPKSTPTVLIKRYTSTRCRFCDKLLASEHDLQIHETMHVNNYDFRCTACNEEFVDGEDLIRHRRMHKKRLRRSFQCAHCGIIMNDANLMKQHIDTHSGFANTGDEQLMISKPEAKSRENTFACQICRLWFDGNKAFRKHLGTHRVGKAFRCKTCPRGYDKMSSLKFHQKSHKAVSPHGCGLCSENFDRPYRLTKHLLHAHGLGRFGCRKCDLRFLGGEERDKHEKKHNNKSRGQYTCAVCEAVFITVAGLRRHVKGHRAKVTGLVRKSSKEELKPADPVEDGSQSFWCMICQAMFAREEDLLAHGSKHFKCDLCATEFADAMELECHMLDHAALERNICLNCGDSFESQDFLWEHTLSHHDDSQACRCEKCHAVLLSHRHSQIHMLAHPLEEESDYHCDYYCNMCQTIFTTESFFNIHNERHKSCQICSDISDDLTLHLLQNHSLPQVEKCYHCDRVLTDPVTRAEHLNTHAVSPEVLERCVDCEAGFTDMESLDEHLRSGHNLVALKCFVCGMLCLGKDDLDHHLRSEHTVYSVHRCNKCTKIFLNSTMDAMLQHALDHQPNVSLSCCVCGSKFVDENSLWLHLQTHPSLENLYECVECGQKFSSTKDVRYHSRVEHGVVDRTDECQIACGICGATMKLASMVTHVANHLSKGKRFSCQVCSLGFSTKASLERHVLIHTDEKPAVCDVCGQGFRNDDRLNAHRLSHSAEYSHTCSVDDCGQQFKLRGKLRDHLTRKHGFDAPFCCILCEQKFVYKSQLRDHMRKHGGGRQFKCHHCQMELNTPDSLRMHLKRKHNERTSRCQGNECDYCLMPLSSDEMRTNHVCPTGHVVREDVAMETEDSAVAMGSDPVAIAMGQISTSQDDDGYVYIALDEAMESNCPICMEQFSSQEEASAHMMVHQEVIAQ